MAQALPMPPGITARSCQSCEFGWIPEGSVSQKYMGGSKNRVFCPPKAPSILRGFGTIIFTIHFGGFPTILGNSHIKIIKVTFPFGKLGKMDGNGKSISCAYVCLFCCFISHPISTTTNLARRNLERYIGVTHFPPIRQASFGPPCVGCLFPGQDEGNVEVFAQRKKRMQTTWQPPPGNSQHEQTIRTH